MMPINFHIPNRKAVQMSQALLSLSMAGGSGDQNSVIAKKLLRGEMTMAMLERQQDQLCPDFALALSMIPKDEEPPSLLESLAAKSQGRARSVHENLPAATAKPKTTLADSQVQTTIVMKQPAPVEQWAGPNFLELLK